MVKKSYRQLVEEAIEEFGSVQSAEEESAFARIYRTQDEAIEHEIIAAIEATDVATRDEYDIEAIAADVLEMNTDTTLAAMGFYVAVTVEEFWASVQSHARASETEA